MYGSVETHESWLIRPHWQHFGNLLYRSFRFLCMWCMRKSWNIEEIPTTPIWYSDKYWWSYSLMEKKFTFLHFRLPVVFTGGKHFANLGLWIWDRIFICLSAYKKLMTEVSVHSFFKAQYLCSISQRTDNTKGMSHVVGFALLYLVILDHILHLSKRLRSCWVDISPMSHVLANILRRLVAQRQEMFHSRHTQLVIEFATTSSMPNYISLVMQAGRLEVRFPQPAKCVKIINQSWAAIRSRQLLLICRFAQHRACRSECVLVFSAA